jgi:hypothetical protein
MGVMDDQILMAFLNKRSEVALAEIKETGGLSESNAMPLMLKSQFNHIAHLDLKLNDLELRFSEMSLQMRELITRKEFQQEFKILRAEVQLDNANIRQEMSQMKKELLLEMKEQSKTLQSEFRWLLGTGLAFISVLMTVLQVFMH